ncbi:MAG: MATE family efflux transporter [Clostridia bacterium]|nr:MATE family efflux transporter [Clostridia bacterium]
MSQSTSRSFYSRLFRMVLPMAAQHLMVALVSASDTIMMGMLDQSNLSAVSQATRINFFESFMIFGVTAGISAMAAQYWGKGDSDTVERIQAIALRYTMPFAILTCLACLLFPETIMGWFVREPELVGLGLSYLRHASFSYLFLGYSQVALTVMKNSGRVARSSAYGILTVVLNIALNAVLIFGLFGICRPMGIVGAALATSISRGVEVVLCLLENVRQKVILLKPRLLVERMPRLEKDFWHYAWPLIANTAAWGGGMTMYSVVIGRFGSDVIAAHSVANIVKDCCDCVGSGVGGGGGILLGNELGRNEFDRARKDGRRLVILSLIVGVGAGLVLLAISPAVIWLAGTLTRDLTDAARGYLRGMLYMCGYYMIGRTLNTMLINGIFSAGGDTRFGFWCDLANLWGLIIPAAWIAALLTDFANPLLVYFILYLDEFTKIPIEYMHYKKYRWLRNITSDAGDEGVPAGADPGR